MFDSRIAARGALAAARYAALAARKLVADEGWRRPVPANRAWWQKPGLAVMYQIELRPGWKWDRDYEAFNRSLTGPDGGFAFNGPYCPVEDYVRLSQEIGLDFHSFESKWHDGICWFDTRTTAWKTPVDYCRGFAEASRAAGIPFQYYYSTAFDHNPQFDAVQPNPHTTPSFLGTQAVYRAYLRAHFAELMAQYRPDGLWLDWYWEEESTETAIGYLRERHPGFPFTMNLANLFPASFGRVPVTSSEAHCYDGPWVVLRQEDVLRVPVLTSAVKWSNAFRMLFDHPWELCTPAGKWWQDPSLRGDPDELLRQTAVVLACGGKLHIGATAQMAGDLYPDQVAQLRRLGAWYRPRKHLFTEAAPIPYRWFSPRGVQVTGGDFDVVASRYEKGILLHLINRTGDKARARIALRGKPWSAVKAVRLLPHPGDLAHEQAGTRATIEIPPESIDAIDTILYLELNDFCR
jgi:hypothetical protein